jgi:hypothetical protein
MGGALTGFPGLFRDVSNGKCLLLCGDMQPTPGSVKLHKAQEHPDEQILQHVQEIIAELAAAGVESSPEDDLIHDADGDDDAWVDDDGDVDME